MSQQPIFGLTNIPQDIKLELNNGTLTLKSGSILTAPNGIQTQTTADKTRASSTNADGQYMVFPAVADGAIQSPRPISAIFSGSTEPTGVAYGVWLNTSNTKIYSWNGSSWAEWAVALPIAIITYKSNVITSIDQVFNGFGYIGSTLFVLPGVEGFYPNGKDGFDNLFSTVQHNVLSFYTATTAKTNSVCTFYQTSTGIWSLGFEIVDDLSDVNLISTRRYYNKSDNFNYAYIGGNLSKETSVPFGYFTTSSTSPYSITSFEVVNPFATSDFYDYLYASNKPLSQYANSQKFMDLYNNLCGMFSNSKTLEDWYNVVFNLKTASGYGLDIWGKILNQGKQFSYVDNGTTVYIYLGGEQTIDGITYSAEYMEDMYRMVLFLKALTYISNCTLASLNSLLQFYFKDRIDPENNQNVYVINYGTMEIRYVFQFYVSNLEKSIFTSDVMPRPTGVLANFEFVPYGEYFGFFVGGIADPEDQPYTPFDNKPFYR